MRLPEFESKPCRLPAKWTWISLWASGSGSSKHGRNSYLTGWWKGSISSHLVWCLVRDRCWVGVNFIQLPQGQQEDLPWGLQ